MTDTATPDTPTPATATLTTAVPDDTTTGPEADPTSAEAFSGRVLGALIGAQQLVGLYLGDRLGWYTALAEHGPTTSAELASRTGTDERYAREWLEYQAVCGWVTVDDPAAAPEERRFTLPPGHAEVLAEPLSLFYMAPFGRFLSGLGGVLDDLVEAYRTGGGVGWAAGGAQYRHAQGDLNRPLFLRALTQELLPQVPDLHDRLRAGARVADIGCGVGWSSIALALGYPGCTVDGVDVDGPSVHEARAHAAEAGVADRVRFVEGDARDLRAGEPYDAVFAFECVHDMADPVGVLAAVRASLAEDGVVVVMDEHTEEAFTAPGSEVEQLLYGFSVSVCLPDGRSSTPSAATGTVMRPATLRRYARQAGFARVEELPVEHDLFRFYRLVP